MRISDVPLNQRTLLITGCSSGIGHHCAIALHKKGYRIFPCARKASDVEALKALGLDAYQMDLADSTSIKLVLKQILDKTEGQLFALFNNAGFGQPGAIEDLSREALRQQFETNVFGTLELTNLVLPIMRAQGYGRIIQNSSLLGFVCLPFRGAYNASKHALEALSDTLRLELNPTAITVSTIEPGPIKSHFRLNAYQHFLKNIDAQKSPFQKLYASLSKRLSNEQKDPPFTLGPEAIEKVLIDILHAKKPKARYYVTFPTILFAILKRCLPNKMLDKILLRAAGHEAKNLHSPALWNEIS